MRDDGSREVLAVLVAAAELVRGAEQGEPAGVWLVLDGDLLRLALALDELRDAQLPGLPAELGHAR